MPRQRSETRLQWLPDSTQSRVLDGLAMGMSQNACARAFGVAVQNINYWVNEASFSEAFRAEVQARAKLFEENRGAIEEQQITRAIALVGEALEGGVERDRNGQLPVQHSVAIELLRATRWKQKAGEQHKQFGA